ncbi:MAG: GGDEF domain-containing protein [Pseudomonadota bacterium]
MKYLSKIDLSSYSVLTAIIFVMWLCTVLVSDFITVWATWINFPQNYEQDIDLVRKQALFTATVLSLPIFGCFLMFIRKIELLRRQLDETVRHDDLTGLLSREAFLDDFRNEYGRSKGEVSDAFLIVDADFFKKINDTHGHIAGDRALVAITNALKKGIRGTDRIGRLGGEEFAIHLKNVSEERAREIAERLRQNVVAASSEAEIPDLRLSVSIGAVAYKKKHDVVSLLIAADRLLYKAKDNGRDRVEFEYRDELPVAA